MAVTAVGAIVSSAATTTIAGVIGTGIIASVGGAIAGAVVGQVVGGAINGALGIGGGGSPAPSAVASEQARGLLINSASNIDPLPVIYGSRRVGGTRVLCEVSGASNEYLNLVIEQCEGEISAINTVYLDDTPSTDARFSGLVTIEKYLGTDTQAASAALMAELPGKWTAAHQGKGVAYLYVRLKYDQSAFTSLPTITCDIDGKLVYDTRDGLTKFSTNPALCIRDYLTNTRYGRGISTALLDDASFSAAANHCDTLVSIPGGGTQKLYECTGVVNVDDTVYANMQRLLTSCRGMLVFSGGKYKLVIDKAETPAFTFDEDNITGAWQIVPVSKRDKFNRISASFFNPDRNWQPDIAIQKSAAMLAEDNNLLLEKKLDLPFTADLYRAQHIIQQELKQSRIGLTVQFTALQEGLRCEVGDVVYITHETPGWVSKPFRVLNIDIKDNDEVALVVREYDASVYTLDALEAKPTAPATSLPDIFTVGTPGNLRVTESKYQTTGSAGVKARATVEWDAPADRFVLHYELEYRQQGAAAWIEVFDIRGTRLDLDDITPAVYEFRVKCTNVAGVPGAYSPVLTKEIYGLLDTPADITNFAVRVVSGQAQATLTKHPDLDVRIGGRIVLRWSPLTSGATWHDGCLLSPEGYPGDASSFFVPLLGGTYLAKAQDSTGHLSANAVSFVLTEAHMTGFTTLATVTEHPTFSGTKMNVAAVDSGIQLVGAALFDDLGLLDSVDMIDSAGGIVPSGSYAFANRIDLGSVQTVRLFPSLKSLAFGTNDSWDSRTALIDDWGMVDGDVIENAEVALEVRTTNDDPAGTPTWGAWHPLPGQADYTARAFEFRALLTSADVTHNRRVTELSVAAKQPL